MSVASTITLGFGSFGAAILLPTIGYGTFVALPGRAEFTIPYGIADCTLLLSPDCTIPATSDMTLPQTDDQVMPFCLPDFTAPKDVGVVVPAVDDTVVAATKDETVPAVGDASVPSGEDAVIPAQQDEEF